METQSSDEEGAGSSSGSADGSEEESGDERYYSCDEESASERGSNRNTSSCPSSAATQGTSGEEDDAADVFEDSLDSFFDTRSYIFGQRLQLKNTNNNDTQLKDKEAKAGGDSRASASTKRKDSDEESCQWRYRDSIPCVEEDAKPTDTSSADDTSHSLDATSPEKPGDQTGSKKPEKICEQKEKVSDGKGSSGAMDKSFNTVMVELSDDLETKLIFSPEGKVVPSRRAGQTPDVGICLGQEHLTKDLFTIRRRKCPLEVVIQARKGKSTFRADVLVHSWQTSGDDSSSEFDDSYEVGPTDSRQTVVTDVKVVARNTMVFKYMRKIWRPVQLTVGLLEPDAEDISQHRGCVRARIVRRHQSTSQETPCFIYGCVLHFSLHFTLMSLGKLPYRRMKCFMNCK